MKKSIFTILLCHLALWGSCQSTRKKQIAIHNNEKITIPVDLSSRRPIVDVTINGKGPYKFIFDTGSSTTIIDEALSKEFSFKEVGSDTLGVQGSDNKLITKKVSVPKVSFAYTNIIKDVNMNVLNLRAMLPIDGVLSGVFFEDYLVIMDYPASELILINGALNKNDKNVTPIIKNPNVLSYNLNVAGNIIEAHLDTGSPGGFSLPYSIKDKLKLNGKPTPGQEIRTPAASFKPWHAQLIGNINVGTVVYENPKITLVEKFEFANFGYAVIKDLRITVDRKNNLIQFEKPKLKKKNHQKENLGDGETNNFTGTYEGDREVFMENGEMYFQRQGYKFKLVKIIKDTYKLVYNLALNNELPNARFERDDNGEVNGITFIYQDGRSEFRKKR